MNAPKVNFGGLADFERKKLPLGTLGQLIHYINWDASVHIYDLMILEKYKLRNLKKLKIKNKFFFFLDFMIGWDWCHLINNYDGWVTNGRKTDRPWNSSTPNKDKEASVYRKIQSIVTCIVLKPDPARRVDPGSDRLGAGTRPGWRKNRGRKNPMWPGWPGWPGKTQLQTRWFFFF